MDSDTVYTRTTPDFPTNQHKYANVIRVRGRVRADGSRVTAELSRDSPDGVDVVRTITDERLSTEREARQRAAALLSAAGATVDRRTPAPTRPRS